MSKLGKIIKKSKKMEEKSSLLDTVKTGSNPIEGAKKMQPSALQGAEKVKESPVPKAKQMPSDTAKLEVMLMSAKKAKKENKEHGANAYDHEIGEFKVEKDEMGMFKESGEEAKKRYLEKLKSRKGM